MAEAIEFLTDRFGSVTWKLWSLAIAESRMDVPWGPMADLTAGTWAIVGFVLILLLVISAAIMSWHHGKNL